VGLAPHFAVFLAATTLSYSNSRNKKDDMRAAQRQSCSCIRSYW
jgi:hypothetical protein